MPFTRAGGALGIPNSNPDSDSLGERRQPLTTRHGKRGQSKVGAWGNCSHPAAGDSQFTAVLLASAHPHHFPSQQGRSATTRPIPRGGDVLHCWLSFKRQLHVSDLGLSTRVQLITRSLTDRQVCRVESWPCCILLHQSQQSISLVWVSDNRDNGNFTTTLSMTFWTEAGTWKEPCVSGALYISIWREKAHESWRPFGKILQILGCFCQLRPLTSLLISLSLRMSPASLSDWELNVTERERRAACSTDKWCFYSQNTFMALFCFFSHLLFQR